MASFLSHGSESQRPREAKGWSGVVGGHKDLQTKLPDFTASSLCLWTGMGLGAVPASHHLEAAPCPRGFWVAPGLLDPSPSPIIVLSLLQFDSPAGRGCLLTSFHPCPPSQEGGIESTLEPGPALISHVSFRKRGESRKGGKSRTLGPQLPFSGGSSPQFSLCLLAPRCQIAITSSS